MPMKYLSDRALFFFSNLCMFLPILCLLSIFIKLDAKGFLTQCFICFAVLERIKKLVSAVGVCFFFDHKYCNFCFHI